RPRFHVGARGCVDEELLGRRWAGSACQQHQKRQGRGCSFQREWLHIATVAVAMAVLQRFVPNRPGNDPKRYTAGNQSFKKARHSVAAFSPSNSTSLVRNQMDSKTDAELVDLARASRGGQAPNSPPRRPEPARSGFGL